eukprot:gb/GECH01012234.1/.p1 GENE.gb/GECH01012234.1/~~gb/GECH01012234.1/.p1  ORF type:complete len:186 (+),score=26.00 gb/GECH01012234.1/:1-558(+)
MTFTSKGHMKGYMIKEGKIFKTWRKRWFVLGDKEFAYFKSEYDADPMNSFWLSQDCIITATSYRQYNVCLKLITKERTLYLVPNSEDLMKWVSAFQSNTSGIQTDFSGLSDLIASKESYSSSITKQDKSIRDRRCYSSSAAKTERNQSLSSIHSTSSTDLRSKASQSTRTSTTQLVSHQNYPTIT